MSAQQSPRSISWSVLGVVSLGGTVGALARLGVNAAYGHEPGTFGWGTFAVNVTGCLLIGMLMVAITELRRPHPLVRPFLGVGVLGGFTTFSTYILEAQQALRAGSARTALLYLGATLAAAVLAVFVGMRLMRLIRPAVLPARRATGLAAEEAQ